MDLEDFFDQIIEQTKSIDIAEAEFKRQLADDAELAAEYTEWCTIRETTERNGFREYCEEYLEQQNDVFNSLTDYDEEE